MKKAPSQIHFIWPSGRQNFRRFFAAIQLTFCIGFNVFAVSTAGADGAGAANQKPNGPAACGVYLTPGSAMVSAYKAPTYQTVPVKLDKVLSGDSAKSTTPGAAVNPADLYQYQVLATLPGARHVHDLNAQTMISARMLAPKEHEHDGIIQVLETPTSGPEKLFAMVTDNHKGPVRGFSFNPKRRVLIAVTERGGIWEINYEAQVWRRKISDLGTLQGNQMYDRPIEAVHAIRFLEDGSLALAVRHVNQKDLQGYILIPNIGK